MIKNIIFDWGGVISVESNIYTIRKLISKYNVKGNLNDMHNTFDKIEGRYSYGGNDSNFFRFVVKNYKLPISVDEFKKLFNEVKARREMFSIAKRLKKNGYKIYIFSNQIKTRTDYLKENNDLRYFDDLFFSNEIGAVKPDKKAYSYVLRKIRSKGRECLFIDDHKENIKAAESLGIKGILFKSVKEMKKDLKKLGVEI